MPFQLAADGVLLLHLAFILFAVLGAVLVARWHWLVVVHLPVVAWAFFIECSGGVCPLTLVENALRVRAGEAGYAGGFIEHYLVAIIYPAGLTPAIQIGLAVVVVVINVALYGWIWLGCLRRRSR